jgi:serine/threonine protein kinase
MQVPYLALMRNESAESALAIGTVFQGGYEILAPLGAGRFGWVYKARQRSTGQDVAIKILRLLPGDTPGDIENQRARFRREMRSTGPSGSAASSGPTCPPCVS